MKTFLILDGEVMFAPRAARELADGGNLIIATQRYAPLMTARSAEISYYFGADYCTLALHQFDGTTSKTTLAATHANFVALIDVAKAWAHN